MTLLAIPREHQIGLAELQALPEPIASLLLPALAAAAEKTQSAYPSPEDLAGFEGIPQGQLEQILDAVSGVYHARANAEVPLSEFVKDVIETMRSAVQLNFQTSPSAIEQFEERLTRFMSIASFARAAKGDTLLYEHERTVFDWRILTDARPVFGDNVEEPPEAFEITHTLKIAFHRGGSHEEEYFALDEIDLAELRRVVERAESKATSLRAALKKSGMKVLREE